MTLSPNSTPTLQYDNQHNKSFFTPPNQQAAKNALTRLETERSEPILGSLVIPRPQSKSDWQSRKFHLQNIAKNLLPSYQKIHKDTGAVVTKYHAIKSCCHYGIPDKDVEIWRNSSTAQTHYRNVQTCKDVWVCAVCSSRITERRAHEIEDAFKGSEYQTCMVTYTMRHSLANSLSDTISILQKAIRDFKSGRWYQDLKEQWGIVGTIKSLEVPYSLKSGWHPHIHELLALRLKSVLTDQQADHLKEIMAARWLKMLKKHGGSANIENGLNVTANARDQYIAKFKKEPVKKLWTLAREVSKGASKRVSKVGSLTPFQILELSEDDCQMKVLFLEYAKTMKGKNQLVWSAGLRALLKLEADESDEDEIGEDDELVTSIPYEHWLAVVHQKQRAQLLKIASQGTIKEVTLFINVCLYRENASIDPSVHVRTHRKHPEFGGYN